MKKKVLKKAQKQKVKNLQLQKYKEIFLKYEYDIRLLLIPVILLVLLSIVDILAEDVGRRAQTVQIIREAADISVKDYPFLASELTPPISAEAAVIMDKETKHLLYTKNAEFRFSMASTTKVMTALVALDHFAPYDILTMYSGSTEGVNVGFQPGEQVYFIDALYALLLPSGNDVANMIAENYPGGRESFVQAMNNKAKDLHLVNTRYADPSGLNDDGNYTTAIDLAHLAAEASKNKVLADITATKSRVITSVDKSKQYNLVNLNRLLGYYGVTGMKTGFTEGAGGVLVTSAVTNGHTFIVVVMRSKDRFADTETLLSYLITDVTYFTPRIP